LARPGEGAAPVEPAPALLEAMADPAKRAELAKVGGVAMMVTFDLLGRSGQPAFQGEQPALLLRGPVVVSMARLHQRLLAFAKDAETWRRLPDELRFPGGIGRLHGFVIDRPLQDVLLIGVTAEQAAARLDVDAVILALRAVWARDGMPAVSLDPLLESPGGPQYTRVIDVPRDSIVAKIMLDADYAMKRLLFGDLVAAEVPFKSLLELQAERPGPDVSSRNRYWFTPMPLRPGSLGVSASGRTLLVAAGVRVLTESQGLADGALVDTGRHDPVAALAAEVFTRALPSLSRLPAIQPPFIFQRLNGLTDAVTIARLWREIGIKFPVLGAWADLPYRPLRGREAVAAFYPGITRTLAIRESLGVRQLSLAGGVSLTARPTLAALARRGDSSVSHLEATADRLLAGRDWMIRHPGTVALPGSPMTLAGRASSIRQRTSIGRETTLGRTRSQTSWAVISGSKLMHSRSSFPASTLEKSRMSLMSESRASELRLMV